MSGPLQKLFTAMLNGAGAQTKLERAIGEEFYRAADDVPDMFSRGRYYRSSRPGLEEQFGVKFADHGPYSTRVSVPGRSTVGDARMDYVRNPGPDETFAFPHDRPRVMFDTVDLSTGVGGGGEGAGRQAYAAMYGDLLLDDPKLVNMVDTTGLTRRNEHRRNYNMAAAMLRDPRLSRQIAIDPFQMREFQRRVDPEKFMRRGAPEQVGALQAVGALQTLRRLEETESAPGVAPEMVAKLRAARIKALRESEDPKDFMELARLLRQSGAAPHFYDTVGEGALRRAALVSDIVDGRPGWRSGLYSGLEFRRGGAVAPLQQLGEQARNVGRLGV